MATKRRRNTAPVWIIVLTSLLVGAVIGGAVTAALLQELPQPQIAPVAQPKAQPANPVAKAIAKVVAVAQPNAVSPELALIRQWLKVSTDSGEWEEVHFEPQLKITAEMWYSAKMVLNRTHSLFQEACDMQREDQSRFFHLRYRTATPQGGMQLMDRIFHVKDGRVLPVSSRLSVTLCGYLGGERIVGPEANLPLHKMLLGK